MYYFYGEEEYLINKEINKIINEKENHTVFKLNNEISLSDVINQISSFSLFDENKIIIFQNFKFLNSASDSEMQAIIKAIKSKPSSNIIIFTSEKILEKSGTNQLLNYIKNNSICKEFNKLNNEQLAQFIKTKLANLNASIDNIDLFYFLSIIPNKLNIIEMELDKLIALDRNISRENINSLVQKYSFDNAYDFINAFHNQDAELLFKAYYEKINQGESIQNLIIQISNVLELCSRIYSLKKLNITNEKIELILNKHPFIIKKNLEFLLTMGYEKIQHYLKIIADLDSNIKLGKIDEKIGFEKFLLEIIQN